MSSPFIQVETIGGSPRQMKIGFAKEAPAAELFSGLQEFFENALAEDCCHYVLDMHDLPYPTTNVIALIIAVTVRARLRQGEVVLENVSHTARDNFLTFSALNYLRLGHDSSTGTASELTRPEVAGAGDLDLDATALVEIAEPPVVRQLDQSLQPESTGDFFAPARNPEELHIQSHSRSAESKAANLYQLCDFVVEHARLAGMREKDIGKIRIAVYEACLNVIEHAYHSNPDEWIDLTVHYTGERFVIVILDRGLSFDMKPPQAYDVEEAVEARRTGGFGMHIIKRAIDEIAYYPDVVKGNRLVLTKNLR